MKGPGDIIRRASLNRNLYSQEEPVSTPVPAPTMMDIPAKRISGPQSERASLDSYAAPEVVDMRNVSAGEEEPSASDGDVQTGMRMPVAKNIGGHQVYRSLMRSHDRMGTRHIGHRG